MNKIVILGGNYGNAGAIKGAEEGAKRLKDYVLSHYEVEDGGDLHDYSQSGNKDLDCIDEFKSVSEILRQKVYQNLYNGRRVLTIGGDHSIAFGTIWGAGDFARKKDLKFGVIYVDAHGDINDCQNSITGHIHGMPLAYAMGIENFGYERPIQPILNPENLLYVGTRSLDGFEQSIIADKDISVISSDEINSLSLNKILDRIACFIRNNEFEAIHCSIDIDTVDPIYAPATGVPEADGIASSIFLEIVKYITRLNNVYSVDFVEFNPLLDHDGKTEKLCQIVCDEILLS